MTITRSTIEHSVLLENSRIVDVRLESSLIGRRVKVHPVDARHGAVSMLVGDDSVVELAKNE